MDKVVHFEIPADNVDRAQKFYNMVFGWKMNHIPEMNYTTIHTAPTDEKGMIKEMGVINGGMTKREEPVKSTVITIDVPNIEEALKKVEKNGGKIIKAKIQVGDMGFSAYFKDTEGNIVGLWQNMRK